jgi:hypothetical protein
MIRRRVRYSAARRYRRHQRRWPEWPGAGRRFSGDDDGVVAAQFEDGFAQALGPYGLGNDLPMRVEPVADERQCVCRAIFSPTRSPMIMLKIPSGTLLALSTSEMMFMAGDGGEGRFSLGFQRRRCRRRQRSWRSRLQTATGKLKAEMMPTRPGDATARTCGGAWALGVHGQAVQLRESPTAKSQMSIISCTSPSPSW